MLYSYSQYRYASSERSLRIKHAAERSLQLVSAIASLGAIGNPPNHSR